MQDKITIADAPDCLNTNDKAMWVLGYEAAIDARGQCLHQIQEPSPVLEAPKLDEAWKARMLDGQPLLRDKDGIGFHPALPDFDESTKCADFFAALGIELKGGRAENEMDSDAYEAMTGNGLSDANDNYNAWTPMRPKGEGWNLVAVFDTEDGPACWWMRDMPFVPQRSEGYRERVDNAAVEVLSMNMKAKLAGQRAKGYRGWNNDCTQQRLSDLLRGCVEKGDPVDVANFCAFLLSRGETITPRAAPVAVAVPEETQIKALMRKHRIWIEHSTLLEDDEPPRELRAVQAEQHQFEAFVQDLIALAATPAAMERTCGVCGADEAFTGTCGGGRANPTALCFEGAVATAIPAASAPVVLPEPAIAEVMKLVELHRQEIIKAMDDEGSLVNVQSAQDAIEAKLRALLATATGLPAQAVPAFCHVASLKLKSLQERGYQITGYALEKPVEGAQPERGFINHGGFVGWWWDGQSPQAQADARDADVMYYLQDARWSAMVGNCPSFWRSGGGYTTSLDDAERFTLEAAMKQHKCRETDLPWLCSELDKLRRPTVDCQYMPRSWDAQRAAIAAQSAAKEGSQG